MEHLRPYLLRLVVTFHPMNNFNRLNSFWSVTFSEWKYWLPGSILCFYIASLIMSGWPLGLIPNLQYPYLSRGDGLLVSSLIQRLIEGSVYENARLGYPFGANLLDYPGSDLGNYFALKLISLLSGNYYATFNLYYLIGFSVAFPVSFIVFRTFGINKAFSLAASMLFVFSSFHFSRIGHLFYTWYFVIPIFYYLGFRAYFVLVDDSAEKRSWVSALMLGLLLIMLASFGVYYALFGLIVIAVSAMSGMIQTGRTKNYKFVLFLMTGIIVGVLINLSPNIINKHQNGPNPDHVGERGAFESEIYGFKFIQLFMPHLGHRNVALRNKANNYYQSIPGTNENITSNLGLVGALGFSLLLCTAFVGLSGRKVNPKLLLLSLLVLALFLIGVSGGLGTFFAIIVTPSIRAWNRISIFISFAALLGFFYILQLQLENRFTSKQRQLAYISIAAVLFSIGMYDQTPASCAPCNVQTKNTFDEISTFIRGIENSLPTGSAIYQLPYMGFPEVPAVNDLPDYQLFEGFLGSKSLRFSYGGMRGRPGDLFYRDLATKPLDYQLKVLREMGFAGIYIDLRGYKDHGKEVVSELTRLLGSPPESVRADGNVVFFRLIKT